MSELYIPPAGISFKLYNYHSGYVIFDGPTPFPGRIWHIDPAIKYGGQAWQVVHGTGKHEGKVAFKSDFTGKVIFVRTDQNPPIIPVDEGDNDGNWFNLEPGTGKLAHYFRICNLPRDQIIYSRRSADPTFHTHQKTGYVKYDDHYWRFDFEEVESEFVKIEYTLDSGKILSSTPLVVGSQTLENKTDHDQEMSFALDVTESHTSIFEHRIGFTVGAEMKFKAGIPVIGETEFTVSASMTNEWTTGSSDTFSKTYTATFPVKAGPRETIRAVSSINRGILEVPYKMTLKTKPSGVEVMSNGIWTGVSTWDLRHTIERIARVQVADQ